jgi:hypothetical protein
MNQPNLFDVVDLPEAKLARAARKERWWSVTPMGLMRSNLLMRRARLSYFTLFLRNKFVLCTGTNLMSIKKSRQCPQQKL